MGGAGGAAAAQSRRACSAAASAGMSGPGPGPGPGGGKLDINRAGVAELEGALSGIGRRRARGIVRKREVRRRRRRRLRAGGGAGSAREEGPRPVRSAAFGPRRRAVRPGLRGVCEDRPQPRRVGAGEEPRGPSRAGAASVAPLVGPRVAPTGTTAPPRPPGRPFPSARSGPGPPGPVSVLSLRSGPGGGEGAVTVRRDPGAGPGLSLGDEEQSRSCVCVRQSVPVWLNHLRDTARKGRAGAGCVSTALIAGR